MTLFELRNGETGYVDNIEGAPILRTHLEEMGFVRGQKVTRIFASPVGTPVVFSLMGEKVALRKEEARRISLSAEPLEDDAESGQTDTHTDDCNCPDSEAERQTPVQPHLCPICRKSELSATGNCPNCTTTRTFAPAKPSDITIALVGNPNCGKTAFFNAACGGHERTGNYAGVTVTSVVGEMTLEGQHLRIIDLPGTYSLRAYSPEEAYVARELSTGAVDAVVNVLDAGNLERNLLLTLQLKDFGLPVVGALNMYDELRSSRSFLNADELEERLGIPLLPTVASKGEGVKEALRKAMQLVLMRREGKTPGEARGSGQWQALQTIRRNPESNAAINARIRQILSGIYTLREGRQARLTAMWDRIFVSTPLAYLLFAAVMWLIFEITFTIGDYPMQWIDSTVGFLADTLDAHLEAGWLQALLIDGVLRGLGAVLVFLPNILILYLLISILEDSGYLARAATLADPLLKFAGLHGKSFIPMLMGFGCNVPAVMATRTIDSRKSRLVTMLSIPFISCSARLPVFTIFTGAFFPRHGGTVMFLLYMGSIVVSFASAVLFSKVLRRQQDGHFVMEIPPYRRPLAGSVLSHTWERGREYLHKMSHVILLATLAVWALQYFPRGQAGMSPSEQQEQSYLGRISQTVQPVFEPLGYNWQMTAGILAGASAKELMVSTLGVIYGLEQDDVDKDIEATEVHTAAGTQLARRIREEGTTPAQALSFIIFALTYIPCIATVMALRTESGSWKYALADALYTLVVAYALAFIAYQAGMAFL